MQDYSGSDDLESFNSSSALLSDSLSRRTSSNFPLSATRRHRSNTMTSIMSGYEIVKNHMDKKKFAYLVLSSLSIYLAFVVAFAPRTSLSRDFRRWHSSRLTNAEVYRIYLDCLQNKNYAGKHVENYMSYENTEGDDNWSLRYTNDQLEKLGFHPKLERYYPWISKNIDTQVELNIDGRTIWQATLLEDCISGNCTKSVNDRPKAFHYYSPSGSVRAQYVYCNYGSLDDYQQLLEKNIDIEGKIHIIRNGKLFRGLKVKNAELYGAISVILYNDPADDGKVSVVNGDIPFPYGPARNPSSFERGSVEFLTDFPGDPTTPGYASKNPDTERILPVGKTPSIPSIPMSSREVTVLLGHLSGRGFRFGSKGGISNFDYSCGPSDSDVQIKLINSQENQILDITNIVIEIPGIFSDGEVIIASHRDSLAPITASDLSSGNAMLLEIARGMGALLKHGWKPLRPIKLVSWDGEDHGLIGSTEYVEDHSSTLKRSTLAYLNLDKGITGSNFVCEANPLLRDVILEASKYTTFGNLEDRTLFDEWDISSNLTISPLGGGTDCVPFQNHLGIPSATFFFESNYLNDAIYHHHSSFDSLLYLKQYVDPDFQLHNTMARFIGLSAIMLSENELTRFSTHRYLKEVFEWYQIWYGEIIKIFPHDSELLNKAKTLSMALNLATFHDSVAFDARTRELSKLCKEDFPIWSFIKKFKIYIDMLSANYRMKNFDRLFLTNRGLKDRSWLKHSIFAPDKNLGIKGDILPGLHEAIIELDRDEVFQWLAILLNQINNARYLLQ